MKFFKKTILTSFILSFAVFSAFSFLPTKASALTAQEYKKQAEDTYKQAEAKYNYIEGIYNRAFDRQNIGAGCEYGCSEPTADEIEAGKEVEAIYPILQKAKEIMYDSYGGAEKNKNNIINEAQKGNLNVAQEKLNYLNKAVSDLESQRQLAIQAKAYAEGHTTDYANPNVIKETENKINADYKAVDAAQEEYCLSVTGGLSISKCVRNVIAVLLYTILVILSYILTFAGYLLDVSIQYTIVDMKLNLDAIASIGVTWQTLRDFANMFFIFILLYVAIRTILQVGEVNAKKTLVQIIIVAILINFSIFFTKAIIDFSNLLTLGFYDAMITHLPQDNGIPSLSKGIMGIFNIQDLFSSSSLDNIAKWSDTAGGMATTAVMIIIFIFVTAFSFFAAAFMLIFRYFVIIFLIILSPLAFATYVLPSTKENYDKWWKALLGQATFPILYMILMYVSIIVLKNSESLKVGALNGITSISETTPNSVVDPVIKFSIALLFINAALIVSKKYASQVGGVAAKILDKGLSGVTATRKFTQGFAGRSAIRATSVLPGGGISGLDKKFKESAIGNTYYGRIARNLTTGAVMGAKFGSGSSVASINKEQKSLNEAYAREQAKNLEKEADKIEDKSRMAVNIQSSNLYASEQKLKAHQDAIKAEEGKLKKEQDFLNSKGVISGSLETNPSPDVLDAEKRSKGIAERINKMRAEETRMKQEQTTNENYLNEAKKQFSKQREEALVGLQREKLAKMEKGLPDFLKSKARKETIEMLRKNLRKEYNKSGSSRGNKVKGENINEKVKNQKKELEDEGFSKEEIDEAYKNEE